MNHSLPIFFRTQKDVDRESILYLSKKPTGNLLVFVHGFGGSPITTWEDFPGQLCICKKYAGTDFVFYNYDSKGIQASVSGIFLSDFINELMDYNSFYVKHYQLMQMYKRITFSYNKITLIAHSLGAIVSRRALIHAYRSEAQPWYRLSKMILFAPAHKGAIAILPLMQLFFPGPFVIFAGLVRYRTPTINDVDLKLPDCSLIDLINQSKEIQATETDHNFTIAGMVIWADYERIVKNENYLKDPEARPFVQRLHTNVCNVSDSYTLPIDTITQYLFSND